MRIQIYHGLVIERTQEIESFSWSSADHTLRMAHVHHLHQHLQIFLLWVLQTQTSQDYNSNGHLGLIAFGTNYLPLSHLA